MEDLLRSLNNLTPVIAIVSLATFMTLERLLPYFEHGPGRGRQRWQDIAPDYIFRPRRDHRRCQHEYRSVLAPVQRARSLQRVELRGHGCCDTDDHQERCDWDGRREPRKPGRCSGASTLALLGDFLSAFCLGGGDDLRLEVLRHLFVIRVLHVIGAASARC